MLSYALKQRPTEFRSADCWDHFSSSMGIETGIRMHQWFRLDRPCSDDEMKAWLSAGPVDLQLFNAIQIHLTAKPQFSDGAVEPYPNRFGLFEAGTGVSTITIPSVLAFRNAVASTSSNQRTVIIQDCLPAGIDRDPNTDLAVYGREKLTVLLSNQVIQQLVTEKYILSEEQVTAAITKPLT